MRTKIAVTLFICAFILLIVVGGLYLAVFVQEHASRTFAQDIRAEAPTRINIHITCPSCTTNPLDVQDCQQLLEENKANPLLQKAVTSIGFSFDRTSKIEKRIRLSTPPEVKCYYWQ